MKNKFIPVLFILFLMIIAACETKPTEPKADNPFDRLNQQTNGDPFQLSAKIDNGGITLEWTVPKYDDLKDFRIYRSEQESYGYSPVGSVEKERNYYIDKFIQNGHSYWYRIVAVNKNNVESEISNTTGVNVNTSPLLVINGGDQYTNTRQVTLTILAYTAQQMMLSNNSDFSGSDWEEYGTEKTWILNIGIGEKKVYMKVKYDSTDSNVVETSILPQEISNGYLQIEKSDTTHTLDVMLNIHAQFAVKMIVDDDSLFIDSEWEEFTETKNWHLDYSKIRDNKAKVYIKFKNDFEMETDVIKDEIYINIASGIKINNGNEYTLSRNVVLTLSSIFEHETMISDNKNFIGANWEVFVDTKNRILPAGEGPFILYAKFRDSSGYITKIYSDTIRPQPINPSIDLGNGMKYSISRNIQVRFFASGDNLQMKLSEDSTFTGINWQPFSTTQNIQISVEDGFKTLYAKFKNDFEVESAIVNDDINLDTTPPIIALTVTPDSGITNETDFQLDPTGSSDNIASADEMHVRFDWENDGSYDTEWELLLALSYQYSVGGGDKTLKMQLMDGAGWQVDTTINIFVNTRPHASFTIVMDNNNSKLYHFNASTSSDYEDGNNLEYRWDFDGDENWDTEWIAQDTISYMYADDGNYFVKLSVRDQHLLTNEITQQITTILTSTMTDIDDNVYNIVKIGGQWWMAENLKVTHYRNGEPIFDLLDQSAWADSLWPGYCYYDNNAANVPVYGLLYNWFAVNDVRNIAPTGWHVPTDEEWQTLENYLGGRSIVGGKLKEIGTEHWNSPNSGATNETYFFAVPGGYRHSSSEYRYLGERAVFWTLTEYNNTQAWNISLIYDEIVINHGVYSRIFGFSIRCIKD